MLNVFHPWVYLFVKKKNKSTLNRFKNYYPSIKLDFQNKVEAGELIRAEINVKQVVVTDDTDRLIKRCKA